jgi:hypothetical protein
MSTANLDRAKFTVEEHWAGDRTRYWIAVYEASWLTVECAGSGETPVAAIENCIKRLAVVQPDIARLSAAAARKKKKL